MMNVGVEYNTVFIYKVYTGGNEQTSSSQFAKHDQLEAQKGNAVFLPGVMAEKSQHYEDESS